MGDVTTIGDVEVIPAVIPAAGANTPAEAGKQRVAAYCRVSTEQEEQLGSFQNQVTTYEEKISANPNWIFAGIYADEGISGTRTDGRDGFQKMMEDCRAGKIDRIITKSISRFSRNAIDSLKYTRELKDLGISVDFEEEHINSMDPASSMLYTILASVAEQESRNISEHTRWGLRAKYKKGEYKTPGQMHMLGYDKDDDGNTVIVEDQAEIVKMIYQYYLDGCGANEIGKMLESMEITTGRGAHKWPASYVADILSNEKYVGDVVMQKSYIQDFISHKQVKNNGELPKYQKKNAHPAIIDRATWNAAQLETQRREEFKAEHNDAFVSSANPYTGKIFYKTGCRTPLKKGSYGRGNTGTWKCKYYKTGYHCGNPDQAKRFDATATRKDMVSDGVGSADSATQRLAPQCPGFPINDKAIKKIFRLAFNSLIDGLADNRKRWETIAKSEETDDLQKLRARQMLQLTDAGEAAKLTDDVPEIVKMVLMQIEVIDSFSANVYFLDGTVKHVELATWYTLS